jgi:redox-regulated HSP33 family molecular chaperone
MVSAVIGAIASGKLDTARGGRLIVALAPDALEERIEKWERIVQEHKTIDEQ